MSGLIDIEMLASAEASSHTGSTCTVSDGALLSSSSVLGVASSSEADDVVALGRGSSRTPLLVLGVLVLLTSAAVAVAIVLRGL